MNILLIIILAGGGFYSFRRFNKNQYGSLTNPFFLLFNFSLLYFILPHLYLEYVIQVFEWDITPKAKTELLLFSIYYVAVFFAFYLLSKDNEYIPSYRSENVDTRVIKIAWYLLCIMVLFITIYYFPKIFALKQDRTSALLFFETSVNGKFKLRIILYIQMILSYLLFIRKKNFIWILALLPHIILDFSHGGRTTSLIVLIFFGICLLQKGFKIKLMTIVILGAFFVLSALFGRTRNVGQDIIWNIYLSMAEFHNTMMTSLYVINNPGYSDSLLAYIVVSLSKIFPFGLVDKLIGYGEWYGNNLSEAIGAGFGLAGNLITEGYVYGGRFLSIINPILISSVLLILTNTSFKTTSLGHLYTIIICATMQNIVRSYFWGFILYPFSILLFFLFFAIPVYRQVILTLDAKKEPTIQENE